MKRYNFRIRLQPNEGSFLGEVVEWLNQLEPRQRNEKIAQALLMSYYPLAKENTGAKKDELEQCYWKFVENIEYHKFLIQQQLKLKDIQKYNNKVDGERGSRSASPKGFASRHISNRHFDSEIIRVEKKERKIKPSCTRSSTSDHSFEEPRRANINLSRETRKKINSFFE